MSESFKIRDVEVSDIENISNLAKENNLLLEGLSPEIFGRSLNWLHSYLTKEKKIQILAECPEGVIGHYGGIPFKMKFYANKIFAVLASNLVVDRNHRRQPSFFELQKEFIKSYQAKDYGFAYGAITRDGVLNPHLRMGWKQLGSLNVFIRPISLGSIIGKLVKIPLIPKLAKFPFKLMQFLWDLIFHSRQKTFCIEEITSFDNSISNLLNEWMNNKSICSERSVESLNWRFSEFKDRGYHIFIFYENSIPSGYCVVRLMPMKQFLCLALVDIVVRNDNKRIFSALMKKCISFARLQKADLIASALTDHDPLKNLFYSAGFFRSQEKFTIVGHFPKNGFVNFKNFPFTDFHINWFDHDYV